MGAVWFSGSVITSGTSMSIVSGQRKISVRKRIEAYCQQHNVIVPTAFKDLDIVYAIALIDQSIPERKRFVGDTFYNKATVAEWFRRENKCPWNYLIFDFKRGRQLIIGDALELKVGPAFDNRSDVDVYY